MATYEPIVLRADVLALHDSVKKLVALAEAEARHEVLSVSDWDEVKTLVAAEVASEVLPIGTIIHQPWTDTRTTVTTEWDYGLRAMHYQDVDTQRHLGIPGLMLQSMRALPFGTMFDAQEAFYSVPEGGLAAGTYHVSFEAAIGKIEAGELDYQFTLTEALYEGAQLCFGQGIYSSKPSTVVSYATCGAATALETVTCEAGDGGTLLGTIPTTVAGYIAAGGDEGDFNIGGRVGYGDNRWSASAIRQYLNSAAAAGSWWSPQHKWDRPPSYATTTAGHLSGFPQEFVDALAEIKVVTAKPTCDGGTAQGDEAYVTYDKVFLPSMEQLYWACTTYGVPYGLEGEAWDWWKEAYGQSSPASIGVVHEEYRLSSYDAPTTMRNVFERSPYRSYAYNVAYCGASGNLTSNAAYNGHYVAPAYCIA